MNKPVNLDALRPLVLALLWFGLAAGCVQWARHRLEHRSATAGQAQSAPLWTEPFGATPAVHQSQLSLP